MNEDFQKYRPGVGMIMLNERKEIFAGQRIDMTSRFWQMPQGGIEKGEVPVQAALRELEEEIGVKNVQIIKESSIWFYYDFPDEVKAKAWKGSYRGQKQKWFLLKYLGQDTEINLQTPHPEFSRWQWMTSSALIDMVIPFKKRMYREVFEHFGSI